MRRGQALLEYVIATGVLIGVVAILWGLGSTAKAHASRSQKLILSE